MNNVHVGVRFNGKHSYFDYGLYLNKPPDYGTPEMRTISLDIPGMNGSLDYTEAITGDVTYSNRQQTYLFVVEVGRWDREKLKAEIMNDIHGQMVQVIPDEDPNWYFEGRASVSFTDIDYRKMTVQINVDASPYRYAVEESEVRIETADMQRGEVVYLGQGTAQQGHNSIFYFGSETQANADLSVFTRLYFEWENAPHEPSATFQLNDTTGAVYNKVVNPVPDSGYTTIEFNDIGTVDASKIWRVLVSGVGKVKMYGKMTGETYSGKIYNNRMPVIPRISVTYNNDVMITLNGKILWLPAGFNGDVPDLMLQGGENDLDIWVGEADGILHFWFREGRL